MNIREIDNKYVANTYARFPVTLVKGSGSLVYDESGKEYIDMGSGIAVSSFGISDPVWKAAVEAQLDELTHTSNLYYTQPCALLAQMLCERTGMKKVFFGNSGAEANECAIKAARRWSYLKNGDGRSTIITLKNSFHGRTVTTLAATGQDSFHTEFGPFTEGFVYAEAENMESVKKLAQENSCCAIMMELVQGEGGVHALSKEFVNAVVEFAHANDMLVIVDEVQTGNGRTGSLYAFMEYGFMPDIVSTAKGLAGGLPLGACMLGEKTENALTAGTHGSTFGGNPVCCAGAISVLERIDDELLSQVKMKSKYILSRLEGAKGVKSVSGMGLMLGIECERAKAEVIGECMENGVLVLGAKEKVRLLPALNIPMPLLEKAMDVLVEALAK
ncbi:MAG: acetylornithine/succinylornithine family transaminase [Clostridia bacterium]|nr:acetylornithine/succinylornithine family transaminase [Clostridia bacterium]